MADPRRRGATPSAASRSADAGSVPVRGVYGLTQPVRVGDAFGNEFVQRFEMGAEPGTTLDGTALIPPDEVAAVLVESTSGHQFVKTTI